MKLLHKTALITGGASGIGKAIAERFAQEGAEIIILDRNRPATGASPGKFLHADLRSEEEIIKAFRTIKKLDILVNNAGVYFQSPFHETKTEQFDDLFAVNIRAPFILSREAIPLLRRSKGSIINIASELGVVAEAESAAYCASKAALLMLTRCMAKAYAADGIRANAILPGPIDTSMLRNAFPSKAEMQAYLDQNPLKRAGKPEEVAALALFLASQEAAYVTGGLYPIDGGESL